MEDDKYGCTGMDNGQRRRLTTGGGSEGTMTSMLLVVSYLYLARSFSRCAQHVRRAKPAKVDLYLGDSATPLPDIWLRAVRPRRYELTVR